MKKILFIIGIGILGTLLGSCSDKKEAEQTYPAITVKVSKISNETMGRFLTASGKVEAVERASLSTRTMGYIEKVYVEVGSRVSKGQLLLSINNADLIAQKAQAEAGVVEAQAALNNAEKDYIRFKNLFSNKSATQKELDDITANYAMAKARLEAALQMKNGVKAQFSYSNIRAPFAGVITHKQANSGDLAKPGMPLIQVENSKVLQVVAMVPESEVAHIKQGAIVSVSIKSIEKTVKGKVTAVSASAQYTGGQYLVKIALQKQLEGILSGMYANVQFPKEGEITTAVMVPIKALVKRGELSGIYTVSQSNTAILRWLRLGSLVGENVEVFSGLSAGESYILSADGKLYNGAKIEVLP